jgi:hypothetical protein
MIPIDSLSDDRNWLHFIVERSISSAKAGAQETNFRQPKDQRRLSLQPHFFRFHFDRRLARSPADGADFLFSPDEFSNCAAAYSF